MGTNPEAVVGVDRLIIPAFYLIWVLLALFLTVKSGRAILIRLAMLCLANWAAHNALLETLGTNPPPLLLPVKDALFALCVPLVAGRSWSASAVFGLFVAIGIVHVDAVLTGTQGTPSYYLTLNALFLLQVVAVGIGGGIAWLAIHRRGSVVPGLHPFSARMDASERKGGA